MDSRRRKSKDLNGSTKAKATSKDKRQRNKNREIEQNNGEKLSAIIIITSGINKFISVFPSLKYIFHALLFSHPNKAAYMYCMYGL